MITFFSRFSQKLSWNSPKFLLFKKYLSPLSEKRGEFYFVLQTWLVVLNKSKENIYHFLFFPKGTDRVQMLKECNEERVKKYPQIILKVT